MCLLASQGYRTGVVDITRGELGSRGTPELREEEAAAASHIMGLAVRENLALPDGNIENTRDNQLKVIRAVRRYRPHICLVGSLECRHPDHGAAARLAIDSLFYAGLRKIETRDDLAGGIGEASEDAPAGGDPQEPWRPHHVSHYMQAVEWQPTLVVDVTSVWDRRIKAMKAFKSQFYNPEYEASEAEPETFVSNEGFFKWIEARARAYGYKVDAEFGEPFFYRHGPFGATDLMKVFGRDKRFR